MLKRLAADALAWWRTLRAAGDAPTLAGLRAVLRPAAAPEVPGRGQAGFAGSRWRGWRREAWRGPVRACCLRSCSQLEKFNL